MKHSLEEKPGFGGGYRRISPQARHICYVRYIGGEKLLLNVVMWESLCDTRRPPAHCRCNQDAEAFNHRKLKTRKIFMRHESSCQDPTLSCHVRTPRPTD